MNAKSKSGEPAPVKGADRQAPQQDANSRQSTRGQAGQERGASDGGGKTGIGSSNAQDSPSRGTGKSRSMQKSPGRDTRRVKSESEESIVNDLTGAFKER